MIQSGLALLKSESDVPRLSFCDMQIPGYSNTDLEKDTIWRFVQTPSVTRDDCSSVTFETPNRFRFDMNYVDNLDCYAEISFLMKKALKLTVSYFKASKNY